MVMAMRQAGAEAAAKAGQKKTLKPMPAAPKPTEKDATAPVVEAKIASSMADPSADPEITQAKIPAQLAAEGAARTSVEKIAETQTVPDASGTAGGSSETQISNEQQIADLRRTSSITKAPSKLSENQTQVQVAEEAAEVKREPKFAERPTTHRGSSLSQVSAEEIKEMEKRNSIEEDLDEDVEDGVEKVPVVKDVVAEDEAEKHVKDVVATDDGEALATEEPLTENSDPKHAESTGVSVGG